MRKINERLIEDVDPVLRDFLMQDSEEVRVETGPPHVYKNYELINAGDIIAWHNLRNGLR